VEEGSVDAPSEFLLLLSAVAGVGIAAVVGMMMLILLAMVMTTAAGAPATHSFVTATAAWGRHTVKCWFCFLLVRE